jgi:hypothetical protein
MQVTMAMILFFLDSFFIQQWTHKERRKERKKERKGDGDNQQKLGIFLHTTMNIGREGEG